MSRWSLLALTTALVACLPVAARQADGTLGLIITPNNGVPAIVAPGGQFDAMLAKRAELRLVPATLAGGTPAPQSTAGGTPAPQSSQLTAGGPGLEIEWSELPGGRVRARCRVAGEAAPGTYALEAMADGASDINARAVFVVSSFPDYYVVAHFADTHVGSDRHARPAADIFRDLISAVNGSEAAFAVISGDLTESGAMDQFGAFMAVMDECRVPTFVCPGNHDREALNYEKVFGPLVYGFLFGKDGYLVFDTKDFLTADDLDSQNAELEILRRAIKPSRWSIGVTHRYEPAQSMRSQLILYVDDPLDHLMFGHWHRFRESDPRLPQWQTTPMTMTPAAVDGFMRLYDVSDKEVRPREPERVAAVAPPESEPPMETPAEETGKKE